MVGTKLLITLPTVVKLGDETPSVNCRNRSFGRSRVRFVAPAVRHKCRRVRAPMPSTGLLHTCIGQTRQEITHIR